MSRRYLAAIVDGGGNVPPELHAVRRLVERGHAVTVLADDSIAGEVRATGAGLRRWEHGLNRADRRPENDPARDWECRYPWQLVERLVTRLFIGPAAGYARDTSAAIAGARPDLVIASMFCFGAMVAAEAAGIPYDVPFPNTYLLPADGLPPFGLGLQPARGAAGRLRDRVLNTVGEGLWDWHGLASLNALRAQHGLAPLPRFFDQARRARRHLVMTSPDFDFPAAFPENVRYVGPVLDDPVWAEASAWTPPPGNDPLVLVGLSSTFQDQVGCLQRVVDALATLPVRGIVTTGPALDAAVLRAAPNITIVASAPHRAILREAALVITHGGHGTVVKALAAGVPLIVLPHGRDQADNAARVTARGAGLSLSRESPPPAIAAAVRRVLQTPSFREAAQRLGAAIRRDASSEALVAELEAHAAPRLDGGRS